MRMIGKAFAKKLFGAKYERLVRTFFVCLVIFWGLHTADVHVQIAPFILYLMVSSLTAGVMWQALSSEDNAVYMQNMMMLPFERRKFVFSYVAVLGAYAFLTKTAALLAAVLAVSVRNPTEIRGSVLCAVNAILVTAVVFSLKKYWYAGVLWAFAIIAVIFSAWDSPWFVWMMAADSALALLLLQGADGYSFYLQDGKRHRKVRGHRRYSVWRYLFRYLGDHKNYLANTAVMWCVACALPFLFRRLGVLPAETAGFAIPSIGFAILSLNTPICILLSCDPALERAVRFLPGGKKMFCVPYCLFIFLCNLTADAIFLCSLQAQTGGVTVVMMIAALFFAMQSAIGSVLLEWFCPIRGWKIESDLWHHPRKYIVPAAMLLLAGFVGMIPAAGPVLLILLVGEIAVLLILCRRR